MIVLHEEYIFIIKINYISGIKDKEYIWVLKLDNLNHCVATNTFSQTNKNRVLYLIKILQ